MNSKQKLEAGAALLLFLLWLLWRSHSTPAATPLGVTTQVSSKMLGWAPTQLGAPASVLAVLTYQQMVSDIAFWVDPATGLLITNAAGLLNGSLPVVAISDTTQIATFFANNPAAGRDLDLASQGSITFS